MSILIAEDLAKQYNSRQVVRSLSINVKSGEIVGLLGPNGAGKTTAFYMIVGLASCQRGRILIDDNNLTSLPMHQRAKLGLGYLPQEASIFRKLTVEQNIFEVLQIQPDLKTAGIEEILERLLNQMNINDLRNTLGISLSPSSVLDIQRIIKDLAQQDIGILITDHSVRETLGICTKGYVINEGLVIASGTPEQILDNKDVKKVYLGEEFRM